MYTFIYTYNFLFFYFLIFFLMTIDAQIPPEKHDVCMSVSGPRRVWRGHVAGKAVQGALAEDLGWHYFLEHGEGTII